jgi:hypothetical protein
MAVPSFDFAKTSASFTSLLELPWAQSKDKEWYRVALNPKDPQIKKPSATDVDFMKIANHAFGYGVNNCGFGYGTSPELGNTILIDAGPTQHYGVYKSTPANAFISVHEQIHAGDGRTHTIQSGTDALTTHAFMQNLYRYQGMSHWGDWSIGFTPSKFNIFKKPANMHESLFLQQTARLLNTAHNIGHGKTRSDLNFTTNTGMVGRLKIYSHADNPELLNSLQDKIAESLTVCSNTSMSVQTQKNKLTHILG